MRLQLSIDCKHNRQLTGASPKALRNSSHDFCGERGVAIVTRHGGTYTVPTTYETTLKGEAPVELQLSEIRLIFKVRYGVTVSNCNQHQIVTHKLNVNDTCCNDEVLGSIVQS